MKEMIIDTLFGRFCDMEIAELTEAQGRAVAAVVEHFKGDTKGKIYVENIISDTMCLYESIAFREGFNACAELFKTLLGW